MFFTRWAPLLVVVAFVGVLVYQKDAQLNAKREKVAQELREVERLIDQLQRDSAAAGQKSRAKTDALMKTLKDRSTGLKTDLTALQTSTAKLRQACKDALAWTHRHYTQLRHRFAS